MRIYIDEKSGVPIYKQIFNQIKEGTQKGLILPGQKLPSSRKLAYDLSINRNTIINAYEELKSEGLISGFRGRGTYISGSQDIKFLGKAKKSSHISWESHISHLFRNLYNPVYDSLTSFMFMPDCISFIEAYPDAELFPIEDFKKCINYILKESSNLLLQYGPINENFPLKIFIQNWMREKGIVTGTENIIITNGATQAMDLIFRILLNPRDIIAIERPAYIGTICNLNMYNPVYKTIPLDEEGMRLDLLEEILKKESPKFIYTMPNFHNPTGITMSLERRKILLDLAIKYKILIIENDAYGELRYRGWDIPPLKASPGGEENVIYISTFSKILFPSLRVGWMIVPNDLIKHALVAKYNSTHRSSQWIYYVLFEFCKRGYLKNHLSKIKKYYKDKLESILGALNNYFPDGISWTKPDGGCSVWVTLPKEMDSKRLLYECLKRKVSFVYGSVFFPESADQNTFRLAFTRLPIDQIEEGIKRIGKIIAKDMKRSLFYQEKKLNKDRLSPLG